MACPKNWDEIPEQYKWRAMDKRGIWWAFLDGDRPGNDCRRWLCGRNCLLLGGDNEHPNSRPLWSTTLEERPVRHEHIFEVRFDIGEEVMFFGYPDIYHGRDGTIVNIRESINGYPLYVVRFFVDGEEHRMSVERSQIHIKPSPCAQMMCDLRDDAIWRAFTNPNGGEEMTCPRTKELTPQERIQGKQEALRIQLEELTNRVNAVYAIEKSIDWKTAPDDLQQKAVEAADRV